MYEAVCKVGLRFRSQKTRFRVHLGNARSKLPVRRAMSIVGISRHSVAWHPSEQTYSARLLSAPLLKV